ncbi:uroporphyrinogen-III synthase [Candidatus Francisella endociliophora]|uniref:Uroporphyrinogen-III synthase n=1 Tax=Candidatus Francisella endociliophora TaxID=653937 RepID=A0A097ER50_9GAMM|nr:uroporphyrinogen-III synthase [Francisella sp. FSC1006]AIT10050.1 uroporphyrinogen-III synthase [Francisella sp. FSC1006]
MNVLVCRPTKDAKDLSEKLQKNGVAAVCLPTIKIKLINVEINLEAYTSIIFTSKYAVESLFNSIPVKSLKGKKIYSVGASTAAYLEKYEIDAIYPAKYNSKALVQLIQRNNISKERFLVVSGVSGNDLLVTELSKQTICKKLEVYERVFEDEQFLATEYKNLFSDAEPDVIITTSLDVFKSLNRILEKTQLSEQAIITITSSKMLEFVNKEGFKNTLKLERLNNNYICKQILELIEAKDVDRKKHSTTRKS